jgi:hypothetical protein
MKPRTLARYALDRIEDGTFTFDSDSRKKVCLEQIECLLHGKPKYENNPEDPIIEIHIGVYIPNFDYPIVPINEAGEPIIWKEDGRYLIPGGGTHVVRGVGLSGEKYYINYLDSWAQFREAIVKVDRYTDMDRAAWAFISAMCLIEDKQKYTHAFGQFPIKLDQDELMYNWSCKTENHKEFEAEQKKLYIRWLQGWIQTHGKNPETHLRVLRIKKDCKISDEADINNDEITLNQEI